MSKVHKLAVIDKQTGEVDWLDEEVILIGQKKYSVDRGYVKLFITFLYDIVEDEKVAGKAIRLLMYMIARMEYNTYEITIIPEEAMKELGISRQTFYNWINILIEKNIIEKKTWYKYKLKPYTAIRGETSKVKDAI